MEGIIHLACIAHRIDYCRRARTLERLGIKHLSVSELTRYVTGVSKYQLSIQARHLKLAPLLVIRVKQARNDNIHSLIGRPILHADVVILSEQTPKKYLKIV